MGGGENHRFGGGGVGLRGLRHLGGGALMTPRRSQDTQESGETLWLGEPTV